MSHKIDYINYIGAFGPMILIIASIFLLINKRIVLFFYVIGTAVNIMLNFLLKIIIKDPRPKEDKALLEIASNNGKRIGIDKYGMPSGHSQSVGFSCVFLYLVCRNIYVLWLFLLIASITMFQRYTSQAHTILQIIVGFSIGCLMGYVTFVFAKNNLKGKMNPKKDDNCFL